MKEYTNKTILILGASFMQIPAIQAAKKLGLKVLACDGNSQAIARDLVDRFEHIDLKDTQALVDFALEQKKIGLDAVFTAATDFSAAVAKIAEKCNLPGHSYEAALNASDKIRMRSCFQNASVPSPFFIEIDEKKYVDDPRKIDESLFFTYPFVVKPVDNMGSRGCRMVRNNAEFHEALKNAFFYSKSKRAIVEEYMEGEEFSIDALVSDNEVYITGFADRHIFYPPYFVEMGHTMPTKIDIAQQNEIISVFKKGVQALGLSHGAAKGDIKWTKGGCKIGEIAARLSGGYMSGWTYPYASGIELTELAIRLALGEKLNFKSMKEDFQPKLTSAERAWISIPGKLKALHGIAQAQNILGVKDVFPRSLPGDTLVFPTNNVEKAGNVLTEAKTREKAIDAAHKAIANIFLELEENNLETEAFLQEDFLTPFPPSAYAALGKVGEEFLEKQKKEKPISLAAFFDKKLVSIDYLEQFLAECFQLQSFSIQKMLDWNGKSMIDSLKELAFFVQNDIGLQNIELSAYRFWAAFLRGSSQALLFCIQSDKKRGLGENF